MDDSSDKAIINPEEHIIALENLRKKIVPLLDEAYDHCLILIDYYTMDKPWNHNDEKAHKAWSRITHFVRTIVFAVGDRSYLSKYWWKENDYLENKL